jgi:hypothetical protein
MNAAIILGQALLGIALQNPDLPIAPPPRPVGPAIELNPVPSGYQILLNHTTAIRFREVLDQADEKDIAAMLKELATTKEDQDEAAKLNLAAFLVASQMPGFKKSLRDNLGRGGVVITVSGLQGKDVKTGKPRLDRAFRVLGRVSPLLPAEARDTVEAIRSMARTTPLAWKIEPRN